MFFSSEKQAREQILFWTEMTPPHNVEAFDADGRSVSIIQETATPFDTPRLIARLRLKRKLSKLYAELSQELQSNLSLTEAIKDGQVTSV